MELRCTFKLAGNGSYPTSPSDFNEALGHPVQHYTSNPYTFNVGVMSTNY